MIVEVKAYISDDGKIVLQTPADLPAGDVEIVIHDKHNSIMLTIDHLRHKISPNDLQSLAQRWGIIEIAVFGSVLRDDFQQDSDIDLLVTFTPDRSVSLFDLVALEDELSTLFGRHVDLGTRKSVEADHNPIRRDAILNSLQVIYVAG